MVGSGVQPSSALYRTPYDLSTCRLLHAAFLAPIHGKLNQFSLLFFSYLICIYLYVSCHTKSVHFILSKA